MFDCNVLLIMMMNEDRGYQSPAEAQLAEDDWMMSITDDDDDEDGKVSEDYETSQVIPEYYGRGW